MAVAVNRVSEINGGLVLVKDGKVTAEMRLEIGADDEPTGCRRRRQHGEFVQQGDELEWIGSPGFPRRVLFAMITCSPFTWRLVVPYPVIRRGSCSSKPVRPSRSSGSGHRDA